MLDRDACERLLALMSGEGADYAEVFCESKRALTVRYEDQKIEHAVDGSEDGTGLRVVRGDRTFYACSNATDVETLEILARKLADAAGVKPRGRGLELREIGREVLNRVETDPREIDFTAKLELLQRADAAARSYDARITQVASSYSESLRLIVIASSDGTFVTDRRPLIAFSCVAFAAEDDEIQSGRQVVSRASGWEMFSASENDPTTVGRLAAERAVRRLVAESAPAGNFPVVIGSTAGGTMVHEACGHGLEADFVKRRMSIYAGKIGETVASSLVTVIDDGTLKNHRGTDRFDDEGTPTERVVLIENGVLRRYLQSRKSARETSMAPTGNGRRESYRSVPIPRMRNTMIAPGESDPAEIIRSVAYGVYVAEMGGGEVDVVNGNFVFEITDGYLIENGAITKPIRGASLIGNGPEVLTSIDMVGRDHGWGVGTCGKEGQGVPISDAQPTLRIPSLIVGGTAPLENE